MKKLLGITLLCLFAANSVFAEEAKPSNDSKPASTETTSADAKKDDSKEGGSLYDSFKSGWNKMIDAIAPSGNNN